MKSILNYIGQLRIYSFVDLLLLLVAAHAGPQDFCGVILLHLGFLAFLETRHSHSYRKRIPQWLWVVLTVVGILLYRHWEVIPFLIFSYLYTKKTKEYFGSLSSISRGFQYFFLVGGLVGFSSPLTWISLIVIFLRNLTGDMRDTAKDKKEHMKTLPVLLGMENNIKYIHLVTLLFTSVIWWEFTIIPVWVLLVILLVEIGTYNLTPR